MWRVNRELFPCGIYHYCENKRESWELQTVLSLYHGVMSSSKVNNSIMYYDSEMCVCVCVCVLHYNIYACVCALSCIMTNDKRQYLPPTVTNSGYCSQ